MRACHDLRAILHSPRVVESLFTLMYSYISYITLRAVGNSSPFTGDKNDTLFMWPLRVTFLSASSHSGTAHGFSYRANRLRHDACPSGFCYRIQLHPLSDHVAGAGEYAAFVPADYLHVQYCSLSQTTTTRGLAFSSIAAARVLWTVVVAPSAPNSCQPCSWMGSDTSPRRLLVSE